ncbi:hypothetical protein WAI453_004872 [Rhynchosporium graminicola]
MLFSKLRSAARRGAARRIQQAPSSTTTVLASFLVFLSPRLDESNSQVKMTAYWKKRVICVTRHCIEIIDIDETQTQHNMNPAPGPG